MLIPKTLCQTREARPASTWQVSLDATVCIGRPPRPTFALSFVLRTAHLMHWLATSATFCIELCLEDSSPDALVGHLGLLLH